MSRRYFGTDGIRGLANSPPMTSEIALKVGMAAGKLFSNGGGATPPRRDRQGHAPVGLHDRSGADVGLHLRRHGRVPARPDADARRRHADALAARRSRRDDLRLAQSLRRQRHQAVRSRRLQALGRHRARDRGADRLRRRPRLLAPPTASAAPRASRARRSATSSSPSARCRRTCASTACASSSIAPTAPAYKVAPEALWELGAEVIKIGVEPERPQHQPQVRLDRA